MDELEQQIESQDQVIETPKPPPPETPDTPKHAPAMEELALELGFTEKQVGTMSPEALQQAILNVTRMQKAQAKAREQSQPGQVQKQPEPEVEPDLGMTAEELAELDPKIVRTMKAQAKQQAMLQRELAAIKGEVGRREQQTMLEFVNSKFDDEPEFFGLTSALDQGSAEFARRSAVWTQMEREAGTMTERYQKSREKIFGKKPASKDDKQARPRPTEADFEGGRVLQPTNRKRTAQSGEVAARQRVKELQDIWKEEDQEDKDTRRALGFDD